MPDWPATLPQCLDPSNTSYTPISNTIGLEPEVGEPITRRRFTGAMADVPVVLNVSRAQSIILRDFWRVTLFDGADRFTWKDPLDPTDTVEMIFTTPPTFNRIGADAWRAQFNVRILP